MGWSTVKMLLALKCEESSRLISEGMDHDLAPAARWAIRLHFLSCRSCRRFRRQLLFLRGAIQRRFELEGAGGADVLRISDEARIRIAQSIADNSSKDFS